MQGYPAGMGLLSGQKFSGLSCWQEFAGALLAGIRWTDLLAVVRGNSLVRGISEWVCTALCRPVTLYQSLLKDLCMFPACSLCLTLCSLSFTISRVRFLSLCLVCSPSPSLSLSLSLLSLSRTFSLPLSVSIFLSLPPPFLSLYFSSLSASLSLSLFLSLSPSICVYLSLSLRKVYTSQRNSLLWLASPLKGPHDSLLPFIADGLFPTGP